MGSICESKSEETSFGSLVTAGSTFLQRVWGLCLIAVMWYGAKGLLHLQYTLYFVVFNVPAPYHLYSAKYTCTCISHYFHQTPFSRVLCPRVRYDVCHCFGFCRSVLCFGPDTTLSRWRTLEGRGAGGVLHLNSNFQMILLLRRIFKLLHLFYQFFLSIKNNWTTFNHIFRFPYLLTAVFVVATFIMAIITLAVFSIFILNVAFNPVSITEVWWYGLDDSIPFFTLLCVSSNQVTDIKTNSSKIDNPTDCDRIWRSCPLVRHQGIPRTQKPG